MGCRVNDDDAWKEACGMSWGRRKEDARDGGSDHRSRISGDDDGIKFGETGLSRSGVKLVRDHIANDLANGRNMFCPDGGDKGWRSG